ncbi:hypothetical protein [Streptomyces sp. NPDC048442]|uniref:hypothetical protein n=1 Tax=Streptomyces sp. NPDC048442 TaxID=3154823 RepID=UPI0034387575
MGVLPRTTPPVFLQELAAALGDAGVGRLKPGPRATHTATGPDGTQWQITYLARHSGQPVWGLMGPCGHEHGVAVDTAEAARIITAPAPEPEPAPADPHPRSPRTHLGFAVPEFVRADWASERAQWWRLGVATAVGKLPGNRSR